MFNHLRSLFSNRTFGGKRSPKWSKVRSEHLKNNPTCAVCGSTQELAVHHIMPFHLYPELELDETNLITLCEKQGHHITFGHLGNFGDFNRTVENDCEEWRDKYNGKKYEMD